jgi:site-specific DNA-methyltransferase (adenine-specific)
MAHSFIHSGVGPGSFEYCGHPTQKPIPLMNRIVQMTERHQSIADPFSGVGATLIAASHLGRKAIGVEIEERYCEIIARRLDQGCFDFGGGEQAHA